MTIQERPLYGEVEIKRTTDVWVEQGRNMVTDPQPTVLSSPGWGAQNRSIAEPGWLGGALSSAATAYIFTGLAAEAIAVGDKVTMSVTYKVTEIPPGTVATHIRAVPHIRTGNVYIQPPLADLWHRPIVIGQEETVVIHWIADRDIVANQLDIALRTSADSGTNVTVPAGFAWRATKALIERGHTDGAFYDGSTPSEDPSVRYRWADANNASASIREIRLIDFVAAATGVQIRRGGTRTGLGVKTDVGLMSFELLDAHDPMTGGTIKPGQEIRGVSRDLAGNLAPIFTGRVVDITTRYPLNKGTGRLRARTIVTVADAVHVHGTTPRYGVSLAAGFETFESRIARLAGSALAPIDPPVEGAPREVYAL